MPRHPPNALTTLNRSHCQCSSSRCPPPEGNGNRPGYLLQPGQSNNAIDVFDRSALLELRRAARLQSIFKTSFSRSNPVPRGQATVIRSFIRRYPKAPNNQRSRATSFLPPSSPSTTSGRLGHPWVHRNWARTPDQTQKGKTRHLEASRSIFSSQCMQNRHRSAIDANFYFFQEDNLAAEHPTGAAHHADRSAARPERSARRARQRQDKMMVELSGIEPLTPCLQSRCSPS